MMTHHSLLFLLLLLGCCAFLPTTTSSPPSSANYNPAHYDRYRHFTPDGRLLQVEYAMRAPEHSSPLLVCRLDEDTLVLLSLQQQQQSTTGRGSFSSAKPQDRMVVIDDGIVLAMSGVLADCLALLRIANQEWLDWKTKRGEENVTNQITIHVISKIIAEQCHANSFAQGIRPYGANILLAGAMAMENNNKFRILQTDPSGAIAEIPDNQQLGGGSAARSIDLLTILGGNPRNCKKIEKSIQKWNDNNGASNNKGGGLLWDKIQSLTNILMESQQEDSPSSGTFFKRKRKRKEQQEKKLQQKRQEPKLEVVLVSQKLGIRRLQGQHIQRLLRPQETSSAT